MDRKLFLKPQDIVILLKIHCYQSEQWQGKDLANDLFISTAEVSNSLKRSVFAGLLASDKRTIISSALLEFLQFGIGYAFPAKKGPQTKGFPTAYSAPPLNQYIASEAPVVWPHFEGKAIGAEITPLFSTIPRATIQDPCLYELLALIDAIRIGKTREKVLAREQLAKKLM